MNLQIQFNPNPYPQAHVPPYEHMMQPLRFAFWPTLTISPASQSSGNGASGVVGTASYAALTGLGVSAVRCVFGVENLKMGIVQLP